MHSIPYPPAPDIAGWPAWAMVAAGLVAGLTFLIWGMRLHRLPALVAGVVGGFILAPLAQQLVQFNALFLQIATVVVVAVLAVLVTRVSWSVFAAAAAGAVGWVALVMSLGEVSIDARAKTDLISWFMYVWTGLFDRQLIEQTWKTHQSLVFVSVGPALVVALFLGLIFPRLIIAIMASLMGAVLTAAGCVWGLWLIRPQMWPADINTWLLIGAAVVVMTVAGTIFQYARAAAARAAAAAAQA